MHVQFLFLLKTLQNLTDILPQTTDSTGKWQGHINLDIFRKLKAIYIKIANHSNHPPEQQMGAYRFMPCKSNYLLLKIIGDENVGGGIAQSV
jgi:hypothetical protein